MTHLPPPPEPDDTPLTAPAAIHRPDPCGRIPGGCRRPPPPIKPAVTHAEYQAPVAKVGNGVAGLPGGPYEWVILGADPLPRWGIDFHRPTAAGLLGRPHGTPTIASWSCVGDDVGLITGHDFTLRPHGHPEDARRHPYTRKITEAWAWASNEVKWRGRAGA